MFDGTAAVVSLLAVMSSLLALAVAIAAWRVAARTVRQDHRPIVFVAPFYRGTMPLDTSDERRKKMANDTVVLENVGRGPALSVIVYDGRRGAVLANAAVVEPLNGGARKTASARLPMALSQAIEADAEYELYCQDVFEDWHLTRFWIGAPGTIRCSLLFRVKKSMIPSPVKALATIARP